MNIEQITAVFEAFAKANYDLSGWDVFTECYGAPEIERLFEGRIVTTHEQVERYMKEAASIHQMQCEEARGEIAAWDEEDEDPRLDELGRATEDAEREALARELEDDGGYECTEFEF